MSCNILRITEGEKLTSAGPASAQQWRDDRGKPAELRLAYLPSLPRPSGDLVSQSRATDLPKGKHQGRSLTSMPLSGSNIGCHLQIQGVQPTLMYALCRNRVTCCHTPSPPSLSNRRSVSAPERPGGPRLK